MPLVDRGSWRLLAAALVPVFAAGGAHAGTPFAGDFMALGAGARSLALGSAYVALADDATAGYWNAAGLATLVSHEAILQHAERFGQVVNYDFGAMAFRLDDRAGLAVSVGRIGVDDIVFTRLQNPDEPLSATNRPVRDRVVSSADYAAYLSYGRALNDTWSVGASAKLIRRSLADVSAFGYGMDVGVRYAPLWGLQAGVTVRDVTTSRITWDVPGGLVGPSRETTDVVDPSVVVGVAYTVPLNFAHGELIGALGHEIGADTGTVTEATDFAAEFTYDRRAAVRLGADGGDLTLGAGLLVYQRVGLDYAFLQHDELDNTHRISASLKF